MERHEGIITVRCGGTDQAWNGIEYKTGKWAETSGSNAHIHVDFEVMLCILRTCTARVRP